MEHLSANNRQKNVDVNEKRNSSTKAVDVNPSGGISSVTSIERGNT
jgi:hypothetical protein